MDGEDGLCVEQVNRFERVYSWRGTWCRCAMELVPEIEKAVDDGLLPWIVRFDQWEVGGKRCWVLVKVGDRYPELN